MYRRLRSEMLLRVRAEQFISRRNVVPLRTCLADLPKACRLPLSDRFLEVDRELFWESSAKSIYDFCRILFKSF